VADDDGVSDGVPDDGVADDGAADDGAAGDGAAEAVGVDEPETGAASAGRMTATVEILAARPGRTLAGTAPGRAVRTVAAADPVPGEHVRAAAAHALMAPTTVSALQPASPNRT